MKKYTSIFSLLCCFLLAQAQPRDAQLETYFAKALADWDIPGYAVAVVKDGQVVHAAGYGVLEAGKVQKVDANSLFAIASNTKGFISTSIAMLVEAGKLDWDDKVIKYLPYFRLYDDYVTQNTTIRDLLCHRVGLGNYSGDVIWYKSNYTAAETVQHAAHVPPAYEFRAGYGYTNLMFIAAGEVIQAVSGKSWDQFARERILEPLGMNRTVTTTNMLPQMENVATPHKPMGGKNQPIPWVNWDNMGAAGGIISSVNDIAKWMQLQLNQGVVKGDTLFKSSSQETLWQTHNAYKITAAGKKIYPMRNFAGYGLGFGVSDYDGHLLVSHGGGYDGMYSRVVMVPEENLGVVVLTNSMKGISTMLCNYVVDKYLNRPTRDWSAEGLENQRKSEMAREQLLAERIAKRLKNTEPDVDESEMTGTYYDPMFGEITISRDGGKLALLFPNAPGLNADLEHWHLNTYKINWRESQAWFDWGTVQFLLDNNGQVKGIEFDVPNGDIFFDEIHASKM